MTWFLEAYLNKSIFILLNVIFFHQFVYFPILITAWLQPCWFPSCQVWFVVHRAGFERGLFWVVALKWTRWQHVGSVFFIRKLWRVTWITNNICLSKYHYTPIWWGLVRLYFHSISTSSYNFPFLYLLLYTFRTSCALLSVSYNCCCIPSYIYALSP